VPWVEEIYCQADVARALSVTEQSVEAWRRLGKIPDAALLKLGQRVHITWPVPQLDAWSRALAEWRDALEAARSGESSEPLRRPEMRRAARRQRYWSCSRCSGPSSAATHGRSGKASGEPSSPGYLWRDGGLGRRRFRLMTRRVGPSRTTKAKVRGSRSPTGNATGLLRVAEEPILASRVSCVTTGHRRRSLLGRANPFRSRTGTRSAPARPKIVGKADGWRRRHRVSVRDLPPWT
jgi:hypothetical protein